MATSSLAHSFAMPFLLTVFTLAVGAVIVYVAHSAGLVIFAWSAPFAIWLIWAAKNVVTLDDLADARKAHSRVLAGLARTTSTDRSA